MALTHRPRMIRWRFCLILALGLALDAPAWATGPRVDALGGRPDTFTDDSEIWRWFGGLADYGRQITLESGSFTPAGGYREDDRTVSGPALQFLAPLDATGRFGTLAIAWHARLAAAMGPDLHRQDLDGAVSAGYALRRGPLTTAVVAGRASAVLTDPGVPVTVTRDRLGLGLRLEAGPRILADLAAEWRGTQQAPRADLAGPEGAQLDSRDSWGVRGRLLVDAGRGWVVTPVAEFIHDEMWLAASGDSGPRLGAVDRDLVHLGLGATLFPGPDSMVLVTGSWLAGYDNARDGLPAASPGGQISDTAWTLGTGGEYRLGPLFTLRASLGLQNRTWDTPTGNAGVTEGCLSAGLSAHLEAWTLDAAVGSHPDSRLTDLAVAGGPGRNIWLSLAVRMVLGP